MKTNFTSFSKAVLFLAVMLISLNSSAKNIPSANSGNLKIEVINNNIVMNWNIADADAVNYCEIQSSEDGKIFTTIGYVMGANPAQANNLFVFKQTLSKMKPGKSYFRVLIVGADEKATSSEVVKIAK
jgi:hypothetical protein